MTPTPAQVLALPLTANAAGAATVQTYLVSMLAKLWEEREGFSGKRPLGDSDWDQPIAVAVIKAGYLAGTLDEYGQVDVFDWDAFDALIASAIDALMMAVITGGAL